MTTPIVSVLMTVWNREKYLRASIESVLKSSFTDFELIIVDNLSCDKSVEIALEYKNNDERIKIVKNPCNIGDYPNRNKAASLARGKYIKYVDADDIIYPHGLEVMVNALEAFPSAGLGLSCKNDTPAPYPVLISSKEAYRTHFLGPGFFNNSPLSAIIKADAFRSAGGFSGQRYIGDTELWLKLSEKFPVVKMQTDLTWWRSHPDQESKKESADIAQLLTRTELQLSHLKKTKHLSQSEKSIATKLIKKRLIINALRGNPKLKTISQIKTFFRALSL